MPLGSLSTRGLAGPNGTPLIGALPAPADPAGGVSCAYALPDATKLPSSTMRTRTELNIAVCISGMVEGEPALTQRQLTYCGVARLGSQAKSESISWKRSKRTLDASLLISRNCTRIGCLSRTGTATPGSFGKRSLLPA
jgi:hypothetical protein